MKVNADKCGVMHIRINSEREQNSVFSVGEERVKVVESYKYLGCIVNEHMEERKGLWRWKCTECLAMEVYKVSMGEVRGKTFLKLIEVLVESALIYGTEVWGSCN